MFQRDSRSGAGDRRGKPGPRPAEPLGSWRGGKPRGSAAAGGRGRARRLAGVGIDLICHLAGAGSSGLSCTGPTLVCTTVLQVSARPVSGMRKSPQVGELLGTRHVAPLHRARRFNAGAGHIRGKAPAARRGVVREVRQARRRGRPGRDEGSEGAVAAAPAVRPDYRPAGKAIRAGRSAPARRRRSLRRRSRQRFDTAIKRKAAMRAGEDMARRLPAALEARPGTGRGTVAEVEAVPFLGRVLAAAIRTAVEGRQHARVDRQQTDVEAPAAAMNAGRPPAVARRAVEVARFRHVDFRGPAPPPPRAHARIPRMTSPCTSVKRMSRPPKRNVRRVCSRPSRCSIVACRSWISTLPSTT